MTTIQQLKQHVGQEVTMQGWARAIRSSGKIAFLQFRDGTGFVQVVYQSSDVSPEAWEALTHVAQESAVAVSGTVAEDARSPLGVEVHGSAFQIVSAAEEYPITPKEHGVDFLMDHRHLWHRSPKQWAIMRVRDTLERATMEFMHDHGFLRFDAPVLTPSACEGTTTLYEVDHFGRPAYLTQSGQLYLEAAIYGHGRAYDFGPVFRAEKSKTRRHLNEFWMMDAEAAFVDWQGNMQIQEDLVLYLLKRVLEERRYELETVLERDVSKLEAIKGPFPRLHHKDAVAKLRELGSDIPEDDDLGADDETLLTQQYDTPIFVTQYPAKVKAFYMKQDPSDASRVLCSDLLAPEGYGEVIGGSEREIDLETLTRKIEEHGLDLKPFEWYLDLRRYGSVPHSGFGFGLERLVTWMCGLKHVRTSIPFARTLSRLEP